MRSATTGSETCIRVATLSSRSRQRSSSAPEQARPPLQRLLTEAKHDWSIGLIVAELISEVIGGRELDQRDRVWRIEREPQRGSLAAPEGFRRVPVLSVL